MKKLTIFFSALAVVILAVGGYIVYELKFKKYEVVDSKVDAILSEAFELELEDGTKLVIKDGNVETIVPDGASSAVENTVQNENLQSGSSTNVQQIDSNRENTNTSVSNGTTQLDNNHTTNGSNSQHNNNSNISNNNHSSNNNSSDNNNNNSSNNSNSSSGNDNNATTEQVTVATIKNKYNTAFKLLETQTRNRLNSLISEAKEEYTAKKNNGENTSFGYFYRKYMGAATALETSTTSAVNSIVKLVEMDLKANGFNKEHAQSFIQDYEKTKESLRSELMKKVLNY